SLIRGFTSNKGLLRNAISTPYSRGATAFYDAVYLGLEETAKQQGRKAIVAFTDGLDNSSTHTVGEVVTYAKNNSIPIFTIGLGEANEQVLTSMAQGTGGQFYSAPTSAELITIFEDISTALSNQYLVSYNTNRDTPDGQIRDVTIGVCYLGKCEEDGTTYQSPADTSPPAGAPDTPSWSAGEFSNSTDITCAWDLGNAQDTGSDIVGYYLQVGADPTTFTYQMVFDDRVGNVKSYKIENLTEGRTYYARVRAENGSGLYSNWSGISKGIRIVTTLTNLTVSSPNIEPLSGLPLLASEGDSIAISFESFKGAFKEVVVTITDVIKKEEAAVLKVYDLPSHGDTITTIYWNGIWTEGGGWHKHNSCYSVAVEAIEYGDTSTVIAGGLFCVDVVHIQLPVLIEYTTSGEKPPVIVPSYKLTYQLTKDAYVTHSVYTDTGLLVRTIESNTPRIGEWLDRDQKNVAFWDMRSHDGSLVPNGIYYWEIMATDGEDTSVPVYVRVPVQPLRLTDLSAVGISEDGGEGGGNEAQINYTMTASAAVTIKIYEPGTKFTGALDTAGNPVSSDTTALVRTLGPFSRGEGSYSEIWNGRDNDGHLVDNGIYIYSITATDAHGNRAVDLAGNDAPFFGDIPVQQSAEEEEPEEPEFSETTVYAYPNPVMVSRGDVVTFRYALSEAADVTIKVYTITGEILWEKEILNQSAGIYKNENWDVRNKGGKSVASGLYIYSVQKNDDKPIIKKLIVIR
ncbi:VWA domain-containing protein, partial [bacterium]|nr:VWA domain-containing protein [bacterium]